MLAVRNAAAADYTYSQFCHLCFLHFLNTEKWVAFALNQQIQLYYSELSRSPQALSLIVYKLYFTACR